MLLLLTASLSILITGIICSLSSASSTFCLSNEYRFPAANKTVPTAFSNDNQILDQFPALHKYQCRWLNKSAYFVAYANPLILCVDIYIFQSYISPR